MNEIGRPDEYNFVAEVVYTYILENNLLDIDYNTFLKYWLKAIEQIILINHQTTSVLICSVVKILDLPTEIELVSPIDGFNEEVMVNKYHLRVIYNFYDFLVEFECEIRDCSIKNYCSMNISLVELAKRIKFLHDYYTYHNITLTSTDEALRLTTLINV